MSYPYSIKNLRTLQTHDGQALSATLYRGKVRVGQIEDTGTGGGIWPTFTVKDERALFLDWVKSLGEITYPAEDDRPEFTYAHTADSALDLLVKDVQLAKEARKLDRAAATNLLYRTPEDGDHAYRQVALPASVKDRPLRETVALYREKAAWFAAVVDVWVPGQGWTPATSI